MAKVCALMQMWNSSLWTPWNLRGIYPFFDSIVVGESCWVTGDWEGNTSPDGTADLVRKFMEEEDPESKVLFYPSGMHGNQPTARNACLHLVPEDTDWIFMIDSDEFYMPKDLAFLRKAIDHPKFKEYSTITVPAKCFYYDFYHYKVEGFCRGWKWFPGQKFWAIASMMDIGGKSFDVANLGFQMLHYSYVADVPERLRLKACIGEDLPRERYEKWYNNIYSKFDGTNLEELYSNNNGGIHVNGGGELEDYLGEHPPVLHDHPLRNVRWKL